jgi:WD40 repeat protein
MRILFVLGGLVAVIVLLTNPETAACKPQMPAPPATIQMAASPDGNTIAVAFNGSGGVELVSTKTGRGPGILLNPSPKMGSNLWTTAIAFSHDNQRIAVGGNDGRVAVWDATKTGTELLYVDALRERAKGRVETSMATTPRKIQADPASKGAVIQKIAGVQRRKELFALCRGRQDIRALAFAPDGKGLVAITAESRVTRWDMDGKLLGNLFLGDGQYLQGAVLSRDGKWAASVHENAKLHIWNVEASALAKSFQLAEETRLRTLAFSPDARKIAIGFQIDKNNNGFGGPARTLVLDVATGKRPGELPATFADAQFSP